MIPCIVIPFLNRPDLLQRCIRSIDFPVQRLLVVNNGNISLHGMQTPITVQQYDEKVTHGKNLGVAGSWNYGLNYAFRANRSDYVIFVGNDIQWAPGDLKLFHEAFRDNSDCHFMSGNWAFSTFAVTRAGFDKLGWFDENFYPAYLEDGDFWRRVNLSRAKCVSVDTHAVHGEGEHSGSMTLNSDPAMARVIRAGHERNWIYYMYKWGGRKEENTEVYARPFNDSCRQLDFWVLSEDRMQQPHFRTRG